MLGRKQVRGLVPRDDKPRQTWVLLADVRRPVATVEVPPNGNQIGTALSILCRGTGAARCPQGPAKLSEARTFGEGSDATSLPK